MTENNPSSIPFEENKKSIHERLDEIVPQAFFMGVMIGSEGLLKKPEAFIKKCDAITHANVFELYNSGKQIFLSTYQKNIICKRCKKEIKSEIGGKFCPYCGNNLMPHKNKTTQ